MFAVRILLVAIITLSMTVQAQALDTIPEDLSDWTERGVVLRNTTGIAWESRSGISAIGVSKVGGTYYMHYLAGFDGCWNADADVNHQSLGLATSRDGINFTRHSANPVLIPHDFVAVSSHEEGIRAGYVRYVPSKGKFYGYFGVESPGGAQTCDFGGGGSCGCNVGVDARVFLATSVDGVSWTVKGQVSGTSTGGSEVYPSGWVHDGNVFGLFLMTAEGGLFHSAAKGSNALNLTYQGRVNALSWGWAGLDAYLHNDNNTITLIYNPHGGTHPGTGNDNIYFATTHLNNMNTIQNERVVDTNGPSQSKIFRDGDEWKWYYSEDPAWHVTEIRLRTHPIINEDLPPNAPKGLEITP